MPFAAFVFLIGALDVQIKMGERVALILGLFAFFTVFLVLATIIKRKNKFIWYIMFALVGFILVPGLINAPNLLSGIGGISISNLLFDLMAIDK